MADKKKPEEELEDYIELDAEAPGTYDPNADKAACNAAGYFYCSVEGKCLPKTLAEAAASGGGSSSSGSSDSSMGGHPLPWGVPTYIDDFPAVVVNDSEDASDSTPVRSNRAAPPPKCTKPCATPVPHYEALVGLDEMARLKHMRVGYEEAKDCFNDRLLPECTKGLTDANVATMEDTLRGIVASLTTINNAMLNLDDGVPTTRKELMSTFLGNTKDALSLSTRRTTPMGTIIQEVDTFTDFMTDQPANSCTGAPAIKSKCALACTPPATDFETGVVDDIKEPTFDGIKYVPSKVTDDVDSKGLNRKFIDFTKDTNKDKYSTEHESCLTELECTFDEFEHPELELEENEELGEAVDVDIEDKDITSGCANGTGLYDKLMTAIDSSIDLQFKNSRLDAKQFGVFYASAMSAAMQQTTAFLIQKKQLLLDSERLVLEQDRHNLAREKHRYDKQLAKVSAEKVLLELEMFKKEAPLQLAKLTQDTKGAEKKVELTARSIEKEEASIVSIYNTIGETNATNKFQRESMKTQTDKLRNDINETIANGVLNRNLTEAKIEQTRVGIRTAKFDAILKKYQAYATKVQTEETKANGASSRRMTNAEIQSKNKQASLYDQQRKTYIHGQRQDTLKLLKDMWTIQIDTLGAEGMVIEALKGPELSSKIERHSLDTGL